MGSALASFFPCVKSWLLCTAQGHLILGAENSNAQHCAGSLQELVYFCRDVLNWLGAEGLLAASDPVPKEFPPAVTRGTLCALPPPAAAQTLALALWPYNVAEGREGQGQLCGFIALAAQVASATPFSTQMLFTALSRLACSLATREPG